MRRSEPKITIVKWSIEPENTDKRIITANEKLASCCSKKYSKTKVNKWYSYQYRFNFFGYSYLFKSGQFLDCPKRTYTGTKNSPEK